VPILSSRGVGRNSHPVLQRAHQALSVVCEKFLPVSRTRVECGSLLPLLARAACWPLRVIQRRMTFEEEYRKLLMEAGVQFDERTML
jgi:hypothetical protein